MNSRRVDNLLREWADRQPADAEHEAKLAAGIAERVRAEAPFDQVDEPRRGLMLTVGGRLGWAAVGAAAALACVLLTPADRRPSRPNRIVAVSEDAASIQARLFAEMDSVFNHQLAWMVETEGDVQVGLQGHGAGRGQPVLLRIAVVTRPTPEDEWRLAWDATVVTRPEELVTVETDDETGNRVTLWALPVNGDAVAVDAKIELAAPVQATCDSSNAYSRGVPRNVLSLATETGEYGVFIAAETIQKKRETTL